MQVIINDSPIDLKGSAATLEQAMLHAGITDKRGLAVAVNSTVISQTIWASYQLKENDTIIIIRATQGG